MSYPDPMEMLRGIQVLPDGDAPWIPDSAKMYFGNGKDTYIWFNPSSGYLELHGVASLIAGMLISAGDDIACEAGDSKFDFSLGTGFFKTPSGAHTLNGDVTIAGSKTFTTGTGKAAIKGDIELAASSDLTALAGDGKADLSLMTGLFSSPSGANTLNGDVTLTAGKKLTKGVTLERSLTKTATYPITDTDPDLIFVGAITGLAHTTITLPTAADNVGRKITVIIAGDPGTKNVILDGEGAETIGGAATLTNSDQYSMLEVVCNGTEWFVTKEIGTWT